MEAADADVDQRVHVLEQGMSQAALACLELANLAQLHTDLITAQRRRQAWWNRALMVIVLVVLVRLLTACGGAPFETSSSTGSQLAGAPSSAGAQSAGAAAALSGGAGGVAGGNTAGSAGELAGVLGGAGGELGGSSSSGAGGGPAKCLAGWQGSSCDTCTSSTPPPSGETCAELLGCYAEKQGPANCDFAKPTTDAVVRIAHEVFACRGGCT